MHVKLSSFYEFWPLDITQFRQLDQIANIKVCTHLQWRLHTFLMAEN